MTVERGFARMSNIVGCVTTATLILFSAAAHALPYQVTIQPINVCDDSGLNCGNPTEELFFAETRKIWAQADINVTFLAFNQFNNSGFQTIDGPTDTTSAPSLGNLSSAANNGENADSTVINIWFLDNITGGSFGLGFIGGNGIAIADETFAFNSGNGRLDTIAHEIGHNLGLDHASAAGDNFNLMRSGGSRLSPTTIGDIAPDGSGFDQLSQPQTDVVLTSLFITEADQLSEPGGIAVMLTGLLLMAAMIRAVPASGATRRS